MNSTPTSSSLLDDVPGDGMTVLEYASEQAAVRLARRVEASERELTHRLRMIVHLAIATVKVQKDLTAAQRKRLIEDIKRDTAHLFTP